MGVGLSAVVQFFDAWCGCPVETLGGYRYLLRGARNGDRRLQLRQEERRARRLDGNGKTAGGGGEKACSFGVVAVRALARVSGGGFRRPPHLGPTDPRRRDNKPDEVEYMIDRAALHPHFAFEVFFVVPLEISPSFGKEKNETQVPMHNMKEASAGKTNKKPMKSNKKYLHAKSSTQARGATMAQTKVQAGQYCRAVNEVGRTIRVLAFERLQVHATLQCLQFVRVTNSQSRACGLGVHQMQGAVVASLFGAGTDAAVRGAVRGG